MRIVSWNVQGIPKRVGARAIADALGAHAPSVIALHESPGGERAGFGGHNT